MTTAVVEDPVCSSDFVAAVVHVPDAVIAVPKQVTLVTVPAPAGVDQVPSPRQYVLAEANVPLFRFVTGRFPVTPVDSGRPVAFVRVPDAGVPRAPPTKYAAPVPTSSVRAARRLALDGVPRKVATPVARPLMPVETGSPVALVKTAADGVPRFGVTKTGELAKTLAPVPVSSEIMPAN